MYIDLVFDNESLKVLSGFYQLRVFTCKNKGDIFFNVNARKEKMQNACGQMASVFLPRKYALSVKAVLRSVYTERERELELRVKVGNLLYIKYRNNVII